MSKPNTQVMPLEMCLAHLAHHIKAANSKGAILKVALDCFAEQPDNPDAYMRIMEVALTPLAVLQEQNKQALAYQQTATPTKKKAAPIVASNVYSLPRRIG